MSRHWLPFCVASTSALAPALSAAAPPSRLGVGAGLPRTRQDRQAQNLSGSVPPRSSPLLGLVLLALLRLRQLAAWNCPQCGDRAVDHLLHLELREVSLLVAVLRPGHHVRRQDTRTTSELQLVPMACHYVGPRCQGRTKAGQLLGRRLRHHFCKRDPPVELLVPFSDLREQPHELAVVNLLISVAIRATDEVADLLCLQTAGVLPQDCKQLLLVHAGVAIPVHLRKCFFDQPLIQFFLLHDQGRDKFRDVDITISVPVQLRHDLLDLLGPHPRHLRGDLNQLAQGDRAVSV
mmetsp:Transcript_108973/g.305017  ORF Transcript_108973/g.305017 Transcript_108973/m.305017 type:complete len:292 (-) Transcript_108973:276-1151(-)